MAERPSRSILFLLGLTVLLSSSCQAPEQAETATRPNVVLIVIDTLRAEALGSYGSPLPTSPELDELARKGVRFEWVISQCTWTRPSIGSMLTSLYPRELGLYFEHNETLPEQVTTLAEIFRLSGYATIGATANPVINTYYNFDQGFDEYIDTDVVFDWMPVQSGESTRGVEGRWLPTGSEIFDAVLAAVDSRPIPPYFLFLNIMDVHEFSVDEMPRGSQYEELFPEVRQDYSRRYMQSVRLASREVARFVQELSELPGWENTLFIITSDHGETLEDHPGVDEPRFHGNLVYESQAWVPLILYSTEDRLPRGLTVRAPMRLLDLMPTVLDLAGLPAVEGVLGRSMAPLIRGSVVADTPGVGEPIVVETHLRDSNKIALYSPKWVYVENRDRHGGTNPKELHNVRVRQNGVATDLAAQFPGQAQSMEAELEEWERLHPPRPPSPAEEEPPPELLEKLRALGYVD